MRHTTYIYLMLFMCSCLGTTRPQSNARYVELKVELDSIPLTAYEYKIRGNEKSSHGDEQGAIEDYTRAIIVAPQYDTAYYNRGVGKSFLGYKEDAIIDFGKATEINPLYAKAYYARGNAKADIGNKEGAIEDYTKAIELNPHDVSYYLNRGLTKYEIGDYEGEIADYRLAITNCAPRVDIYNNLGRALYDLKRFKESAEAYGEGIEHFPDDYKLYYGRGLARNQSGDKKGACEDWRKSSALGCFEANALLPLCDECN